MILIEKIRIIDVKNKIDECGDILIRNGNIERIGTDLLSQLTEKERKEGRIIPGNGLVVAPGLVDVHVHFRDPGFTYKEDIFTGAKAAAAGGFTTVILMANTKPVADREEVIRYVLERAGKTAIHVRTCAAVTKRMQGRELTDMKALAAAGACGFTDDGIPLTDEKIAERAMECAAETGKPLSLHEEDPALIENNGVNRGKASAYYRIGGSPREAEISMIGRDLKIAEKTGATVNIQHVSCKESVELIRQAKKTNPYIHAEATPHHFSLTEDAVIRYGTLAKMNPPLREESDRQAIIEGLRDGTLDLIATDHAPHSEEEKKREITKAPSGIIGLETALALGITNLVGPGYLALNQLIEKMSFNPANMYGLDAGYLEEGGPADLVLFDPGEEWKAEKFLSRASNSPFKGQTLKGRVRYTICNGKIVYEREENT